MSHVAAIQKDALEALFQAREHERTEFLKLLAKARGLLFDEAVEQKKARDYTDGVQATIDLLFKLLAEG